MTKNTEDEMTRLDRVIDWAYKILGVLVIPLVVAIFLWGVGVERKLSDIKVELAIQKEKNSTYVTTLAEVKSLAQKLSDIVRENNTSVKVFQSEFKRVDGNIQNVQNTLQRVDELTRSIKNALK